MTRYVRKCQIAGLAGLASVVVVAFAAAPAGASSGQKCSGPTGYQTCQTLQVNVSTKAHGKVKISVRVNDTPSIQVKLYQFTGGKYHFNRSVVTGNIASGNHHYTIHVTPPGKWEIKTRVDGHGLIVNLTNKFNAKP